MRAAASAGPVIPDFGEASDCVTENRLFCSDWVRENWGDTLQPALLEHIELTLIAVAIGFVIAFVAALLAYRYRARAPVRVVAALIYTIPSLALFQLLVPVTGLDVQTVEIALVGYTLLILFRNILAACGPRRRRARGRARDGPDAEPDRSGGSSFRSLCRRSSPASASRRSRRSRSRRSPPS